MPRPNVDGKRFTIEKRFLVSKDEERRLNHLVNSIRDASGIAITQSHIIRALIVALNSSRSNIERILKDVTLYRPQNQQQEGILRFERQLAKLLAQGLRTTPARAR